MSFSAGPGNPGPAVLMASFPSRVAAQSDRPAGLVMNYPTGASKPGPGGLSSLSFGVSQTGLTVYSPGGGQGSGPMAQSVQQQQGAGPSAGAGQLGAIDMNPEKVLLTRVHISGIANAKSESQARSGSTSGTGAGAGPLVETKSSALTQNVGGKQNRPNHRRRTTGAWTAPVVRPKGWLVGLGWCGRIWWPRRSRQFGL